DVVLTAGARSASIDRAGSREGGYTDVSRTALAPGRAARADHPAVPARRRSVTRRGASPPFRRAERALRPALALPPPRVRIAAAKPPLEATNQTCGVEYGASAGRAVGRSGA